MRKRINAETRRKESAVRLFAWMVLALLVASAVSASPVAAPHRENELDKYVAEVEKAYDYESYKSARADQRHDTEFFEQVQALLGPEKHISRSFAVSRHDSTYVLLMRQRAAILIAAREKWVRLLPRLLYYLDYTKIGVHAIQSIPPDPARWQFPSMACEAILSFGKDALPFLDKAALDKGLDLKLRLAALALTLEIDKQYGHTLGERLLKDASMGQGLVGDVLAGRVTSRGIARSMMFPKRGPLKRPAGGAVQAQPPLGEG